MDKKRVKELLKDMKSGERRKPIPPHRVEELKTRYRRNRKHKKGRDDE